MENSQTVFLPSLKPAFINLFHSFIHIMISFSTVNRVPLHIAFHYHHSISWYDWNNIEKDATGIHLFIIILLHINSQPTVFIVAF